MDEPGEQEETTEIIASRGHRAGMVNVEAKRDGKIIHVATFHKDNAGKRHEFAKSVGVDDEAVVAAILRADTSAETKAGPAAAPGPFTVLLRGMHQAKLEGRFFSAETPLAALQIALAVLDYPELEPVIEWKETDQLAVLDVDFHDEPLDRRPDADQLQRQAEHVRPNPALWWLTHGRGLRLVFQAQVGFLGKELAACAAVSVRSLVPAATIEILGRTRHPAYPRPGYPAAGSVMQGGATAEIGDLARILGREANENLVQEWLGDRGLEVGRRYAHDHCPLDPGVPSHGEPVLVGQHGITCFKCEATGHTLGSRKPGFFPFCALVSGGLPSRLRTALRNFAHWEQAQHLIVEDLAIEGDLAKCSYAALLKAVHGPDDPRIVQALCRGQGLVRGDGYWGTADLTRAHNRDGLVERLKKLPAVQDRVFVRDRWCLLTNEERLGIFRGVDDLSGFGYPRVHPVRGMKIFGHFRPAWEPRVVRSVVMPEFLRDEAMRIYRPRYVPANKRLDLSNARAIVNVSFPGINQGYLELLIAARGCAEGGIGQQPMIAVDGPSSSGKTLSAAIAAALIGDQHQNVPWTPNVEHYFQQMYEASLNAGLVCSDEIIKLASAHGAVLSGLSALLTLTPGTSIRKLYTGPVSLRQVPALIIDIIGIKE